MKLETPDGYRIERKDTLPDLLSGDPFVAGRIGGDPANWSVREVSDGNMNAVFEIGGSLGTVIVKQALPFIRVIGESWPFPLSRMEYEHAALRLHARHAPGRVPEIYHYEPQLALLVMERLSPHIVLRKGLIRGIRYPHLAEHVAGFLARTLFFTSDLALTTPEKKSLMSAFAGNAELCATTEDVIFTGPYWTAPLNRWTSPYLDAAASRLRADTEAKLAAAELKLVFRTATEAIIHGDLHTGSIMATGTDTRIIDPEWAFCGPMGFDIGAVIGNLLLAYCSQPGHATPEDDRNEYRDWILTVVEEIWQRFEREFLDLWRRQDSGILPPELFAEVDEAEPMRRRRLFAVLADSIGFAGAKMIRRILGISHVEDFEAIRNPAVRANCERTALMLARSLMVGRHDFKKISAVTAAARATND
jgi:5-methylthioribose kinase